MTLGCLRHNPPFLPAGYKLQHFSDVTVLSPPGIPRLVGDFQTTTISTGPRQGSGPRPLGDTCVIDGQFFSLHPEGDGISWLVTSPSAEAWDKTSFLSPGENEWSVFADHIAEMASHGCFRAGIDSNYVQRRVAEAIPLPADQGLRFYYSLNSAGFVDLRPDMQLRVETISFAGRDQRPKSDVLQLSVVSQPPLGVALEESDKNGKSKVVGESSYRTLPQEFSKYPYLRLFLERAGTSTVEARRAVLLGVITPDALDSETRLIQQNPQKPCQVASIIGACVFFSGSGVSLLTPVFLNGHAAFYPPGTTLSQLVGALPQKHKARALATVSLYRQYEGGVAPFRLPRTEEELMDVILISGDRIHWRE